MIYKFYFSFAVKLEDIVSKNIPNVCWESKKGNSLHIPFNGVPYLHLNTRQYNCHQGKDKNVKILQWSFPVCKNTKNDDLIWQKKFRKNEENPISFVKFYKFQRKRAKVGDDSQKLVLHLTLFQGYWIAKVISANIYFANNFFPLVTKNIIQQVWS